MSSEKGHDGSPRFWDTPDVEIRPPGAPLYFDAVLHPHRSLGPKGFLILMALLGGVSFTAGIVFLLQGAWPVFGFLGLDVLLVYIAFRWSYRSARLYETVQLGPDALLVRRHLPSGRTLNWRFEPYWVRLEWEGAPPVKRLLLKSHGRALSLGSFLNAEELDSFATAFSNALEKQRLGAPAGA